MDTPKKRGRPKGSKNRPKTKKELKKRLAAEESSRVREKISAALVQVANGEPILDALKAVGIGWGLFNITIRWNKDLQETYHAAMATRTQSRRDMAEKKLAEIVAKGKKTTYYNANGEKTREIIADDVDAIKTQVAALSPDVYGRQSGPLVVHNTLNVNAVHKATLADIISGNASRNSLLPDRSNLPELSQVIDAQAATPDNPDQRRIIPIMTTSTEDRTEGGG